jgi:hypothetical protein
MTTSDETQRSSATRAAVADVIAPGGDACWEYRGDADPADHARVVHGLLRGALDSDTALTLRCANARLVRPGPGHRERDDFARKTGHPR